jgi:lipoprotein-anchoring transpeptidase ErfK/SrfK
MRWWTQRGVALAGGLAAALLVAPLALAEAPSPRTTTTTTDASTTTDSADTASSTVPASTVPDGAAQAERTTTTDAPKRRQATTTTATTTTTIPVRASGTWVTIPGYNPAWRSINPPWVPRPPWGSGVGRRIVYSKGQQRVWLIEDNGYIAHTHLVSGRLDIPALGTYHVYSKSFSTFATHNPSITWNYMVRFAVGPQGGGIGLHEIPWQYGRPVQTVAQLGQPLSGGCLRQSHDDAVFTWNWTPVGTPVYVVG